MSMNCQKKKQSDGRSVFSVGTHVLLGFIRLRETEVAICEGAHHPSGTSMSPFGRSFRLSSHDACHTPTRHDAVESRS